MTKKKPNAGPKRFQPGNQAAVKDVTKVRWTITIEPDQLAWLRTQTEGISPTVRKAIDLLRSSRDGKKEE